MRVLVVDDEPDIRLILATVLDDAQVLEAGSGPEALELLADNVIDVVLLDVMLPGMDGVDVLAQIRAAPHLAGVGVVMLTAKAGEADHVAAFRYGADAYLTKPFSIDELAAVVAEVAARTPLERKAARDAELGRAELLLQLEDGFHV